MPGFRTVVLSCLFTFSLPSLGLPQGRLSGVVTWKGAPVAGAIVRLPDGKQEAITDAKGRYSFVTTTLVPRLARAPGTLSLPAEGPAAAALFSASGRSLPTLRARAAGAFFSAAPSPALPRGPLAKAAAPYRMTVAARGYLDTNVSVGDPIAVLDVALDRDPRRHLWIWGNTVATSPAGRDALFAFAIRKGIGTLYLDCAGLLRDNRAALSQFLNLAKARGLAVELLFGAPQWALPANHAAPVELARLTLALLATQRAEGGAYPTSIQMDVEPYSLPAWDTGRAGVAGGLVDMYAKLDSVVKGSPVGVTACIPRWFDGIALQRGGATRPLSEWLADGTARLTLMDYVDHAKGIIDGAAAEIAYGEKIGKEVVIGVETIAGLDPESVTFAEEGESAMETALSLTKGAYGARSSYFGIAIHHYASYPTLKP